MRSIVFLIVLLTGFSGCSPVLRDTHFEVSQEGLGSEKLEYKVTTHAISPSIVASANASKFITYVNVGGKNGLPVTRITEQDLFSGVRPPQNSRFEYRIGSGDTLSISWSGFLNRASGVSVRETVTESHQVDEQGGILVLHNQRVIVGGLTISEASEVLRRASESLRPVSSNPDAATLFPQEEPSSYLIGRGDVLSVTQLTETNLASGSKDRTINKTDYVVAEDGIISVLEIGDLQVGGLTLQQVRDTLNQEANPIASDVGSTVEIKEFNSKHFLVVGALGTHRLPITETPLTFANLLANLNPDFSGDRDYQVQLKRNGLSYLSKASALLKPEFANRSYIFPGDHIEITEVLPQAVVAIRVTEFSSQSVSFVNVPNSIESASYAGSMVVLSPGGVSLRELLVQQNVKISNDEDLLVRLVRQGKEYRVSARATILRKTKNKVWLEPDDSVIIEDIAYAGENALLTGELRNPRLLNVSKHERTTLSDALFAGGTFGSSDADFKHIYVLRGQDLKFDAYHFDISNILNLGLADKFELRPSDIVFVRTRPISRYNRALGLALTFLSGLDAGISRTRRFGQ